METNLVSKNTVPFCISSKTMESHNGQIFLSRQCKTAGRIIDPQAETAYKEQLIKLIDRQYIKTPFYEMDKMTARLRHYPS